jgi:lysophospholipase L1-like esterase
LTNLLLFGDSISAGQYIEPRHRFSEHLRNFLRDDFQNVHLDVLAKSGQTTRQALMQFPDYLNEYPIDILFVQLGINDANYWLSEGGEHPRVSLGAFRENCQEIISRAQLAGVTQIRFFTNHIVKKTILTKGGAFELNDLVKPYNNSIVEICQVGPSSVKAYDFQRAWNNFPDKDIDEFLLPNDGVHLSIKGHETYFDQLSKIKKSDKEKKIVEVK